MSDPHTTLDGQLKVHEDAKLKARVSTHVASLHVELRIYSALNFLFLIRVSHGALSIVIASFTQVAKGSQSRSRNSIHNSGSASITIESERVTPCHMEHLRSRSSPIRVKPFSIAIGSSNQTVQGIESIATEKFDPDRKWPCAPV